MFTSSEPVNYFNGTTLNPPKGNNIRVFHSLITAGFLITSKIITFRSKSVEGKPDIFSIFNACVLINRFSAGGI